MIGESQSYREDIIFMLTKDKILACASELGISKEQITGDMIELVKYGVRN